MSAHFYQKKNRIYEIVDTALRKRTVRWPRERLVQFTKRLHALSLALTELRLRKAVSSFVRIDDHPHCIFDWCSAPVAAHLTYDEVFSWFKDANYRVLSDRRDKSPSTIMKLLLKIHPRDAVIVKGEKT